MMHSFTVRASRFRQPREPWEREARYRVDDVACRACARHAEAALGRIEGVEAARVGFLSETARVLFDLRRTSARDIASAMVRGGFLLRAADGAPAAGRDGGGVQLGLCLVFVAELLAVCAVAGSVSAERSVSAGKVALAALALATGAAPLARGALSAVRRGRLERDVVAVAASAAAFVLGTLALALAPPWAGGAGLGPSPWAQHGIELARAGSLGVEASAVIVLAALAVRRLYLGLRLWAAGAVAPAGVAAASLAVGDRVVLREGQAAPVDLYLEASARMSEATAGGGQVSLERGPLDRVAAGSILLSADVAARVAGTRGGLAAAMDAEAHRTLTRIDASSNGRDWFQVAARASSMAAFGVALLAAVTRALAGGFAATTAAAVAALAVLAGFSVSAFVLAPAAARSIAVLRARSVGVVVKDVAALEALARVDTACFEASVCSGAERSVEALRRRGLTIYRLDDDPAEGPASAPCALVVRELQHAGRRVLHVGDGWGGRAGAAEADVALAAAPGILPFAVAAPLVVESLWPERLGGLVDLGRALRSRLRECAAAGAAYNLVVIPLAALGKISPSLAAGLTLAESALLFANCARLRRVPRT